VLLWRAGLRITEALTVTEHDLEPGTGSVLVRHGKGGRRREVGMDPWGCTSGPGSSCGWQCRSARCCA
jgi:site-specific recombinase XerD